MYLCRCWDKVSDGGVWNKCTFSKKIDTEELSLPSPSFLPLSWKDVPYVGNKFLQSNQERAPQDLQECSRQNKIEKPGKDEGANISKRHFKEY